MNEDTNKVKEISEEEIKNELKATKMQEKKKEEEKAKKSKNRMYVVLLFLLLTAMLGYIFFRGEYLETLEIGEQYVSIFWQNLNYSAITFAINFILLFFIIYMNNRRIKKGVKVFFDEEKRTMPKLPNKSIALIISIIVSSITSTVILKTYMLCMNSTSFGVTDPVFGYDIGYFMFQKPFIEFMLIYILLMVIGITIYNVIYYIAVFNIYFDGIGRETLKKSKILKQLLTNVMIVAVLLAGLTYLKTQDIGFEKFMSLQEDTSYSIYGAGVTDVTIKLWGYRILPILIVLSIYMAIRAFKNGKTKQVLMNIAIVPVYIVILLIVMLVFQIVFVTPNELDKEKANIEHNMKYTKNAYDINVDEVNIENGGTTVTEEMLGATEQTINNITIVDKSTVLKDLNAVQTEKGYYSYSSTQIASYRVNGKQQLVYISPREINGNGTYNNKTYEYTHGYGVIVTSAVSTNANGSLNNLQKNFETTKKDIVAISEPRIYFGLETNDTVVTNSNSKKEFDYPTEDALKNTENVYDGDAGLKANFLDRLVLAIKEKVGIPVKYIGLGEKKEDLQPFDIEKYIYGLFKDMM